MDVINCILIDGSFNENILQLICISKLEAIKLGDLKIVLTWVALKLLHKWFQNTYDEWKFIALKGKNFLEKKGFLYENMDLGLNIE